MHGVKRSFRLIGAAFAAAALAGTTFLITSASPAMAGEGCPTTIINDGRSHAVVDNCPGSGTTWAWGWNDVDGVGMVLELQFVSRADEYKVIPDGKAIDYSFGWSKISKARVCWGYYGCSPWVPPYIPGGPTSG
jgi:hypothetical protein